MRRKVPAWLQHNRLFRISSGLVRRYNFHDVGQQSAAMAYYLLFTIFPMLIFISSLLGVLNLNVEAVRSVLSRVLPKAVLNLGKPTCNTCPIRPARPSYGFPWCSPSTSPCGR